jgi:hypothetical protein
VYVQGHDGQLMTSPDSDPSTSDGTVLTVPGIVRVDAHTCNTAGVTGSSLSLANISGSTISVFSEFVHSGAVPLTNYEPALPTGSRLPTDSPGSVSRSSYLLRRPDGASVSIEARASALGGGSCTSSPTRPCIKRRQPWFGLLARTQKPPAAAPCSSVRPIPFARRLARSAVRLPCPGLR